MNLAGQVSPFVKWAHRNAGRAWWMESQAGRVQGEPLNLGHTPGSPDGRHQLPLRQHKGSGMHPGLAHPALPFNLLTPQPRPSKDGAWEHRKPGNLQVPHWPWETHSEDHGHKSLWLSLPVTRRTNALASGLCFPHVAPEHLLYLTGSKACPLN